MRDPLNILNKGSRSALDDFTWGHNHFISPRSFWKPLRVVKLSILIYKVWGEAKSECICCPKNYVEAVLEFFLEPLLS